MTSLTRVTALCRLRAAFLRLGLAAECGFGGFVASLSSACGLSGIFLRVHRAATCRTARVKKRGRCRWLNAIHLA